MVHGKSSGHMVTTKLKIIWTGVMLIKSIVNRETLIPATKFSTCRKILLVAYYLLKLSSDVKFDK